MVKPEVPEHRGDRGWHELLRARRSHRATRLRHQRQWRQGLDDELRPLRYAHRLDRKPSTARFPGQWLQAESGLHQNWMRDYDPTTGRYIQPDPLGLVDGASVYGYARQSPLRYTDPTGEFVPQAVACLVNPVCRAAAGAAAGLILGYLFDDDDCYSWTEALEDAGTGAFSAWAAGRGAAPILRPTGPFREGGWWSTGQNWRVGWNRKGGNRVFKWYDRWTGKSDWYDGGPP